MVYVRGVLVLAGTDLPPPRAQRSEIYFCRCSPPFRYLVTPGWIFILFSFPCSAIHERDWPPCEVVFSGWQSIRWMWETATTTTYRNIVLSHKEFVLDSHLLLYSKPRAVCRGFVSLMRITAFYIITGFRSRIWLHRHYTEFCSGGSVSTRVDFTWSPWASCPEEESSVNNFWATALPFTRYDRIIMCGCTPKNVYNTVEVTTPPTYQRMKLPLLLTPQHLPRLTSARVASN